jgi:hypothetical protein
MLNGLALGVFVFSVFQFSAWRAPRQRTALQGLPELAGLVLLGALVVGLVLTGDPRLFIPLALASTLGVVVMLTIVNSIIVLIVAQRENSIQTWRDAGLPFFIALALSLAIIMAIGAGRATLTAAFEIPF